MNNPVTKYELEHLPGYISFLQDLARDHRATMWKITKAILIAATIIVITVTSAGVYYFTALRDFMDTYEYASYAYQVDQDADAGGDATNEVNIK